MTTPVQIRMARAALGLGVRELADAAGVAAMTISRIENGHSVGTEETLSKIVLALQSAGVDFIAAGSVSGPAGAGVRFRDYPAETITERNVFAIVQNGILRKQRRLAELIKAGDAEDPEALRLLSEIEGLLKTE